MKKYVKILMASLLVVAIGSGCKKSYLDTHPTDAVSTGEMFKTTQSAYTALNGIHSLMISANLFGGNHANWGAKAIDLEDDMMGNDMVGSGSGYDWFDFHYKYVMTESSTYWGPYNLWQFFYRIVNNANAILDNIDNAEGPQSEKNDIKGQAFAYRAWAFYKLTVYFQHTLMPGLPGEDGAGLLGSGDKPGVPLYTTTTTTETVGAPRGTLNDDYAQINSDIEAAIALLSDNAATHSNKAHISLATAQGIAARIYLVEHEWKKAGDNAALALSNYPLMNASDYTAGFNSANNSEWMWGSSYSSEQYEGLGILDFISFMDPNCPGYASVGATRAITKDLYDHIASTDVRKQCWNSNNFMQKKFRSQNTSGFQADYCYMRSAEMYLILAEAQARQGLTADATTTLEFLVTTRDPNYVAPAGDILKEILLQRRIELWGEGFAYSDIQRLHQDLNRPSGAGNHKPAVARVMQIDAGSDQFVFKIPQREIDANPNMGASDQNP
jgi:hypothetical protein